MGPSCGWHVRSGTQGNRSVVGAVFPALVAAPPLPPVLDEAFEPDLVCCEAVVPAALASVSVFAWTTFRAATWGPSLRSRPAPLEVA